MKQRRTSWRGERLKGQRPPKASAVLQWGIAERLGTIICNVIFAPLSAILLWQGSRSDRVKGGVCLAICLTGVICMVTALLASKNWGMGISGLAIWMLPGLCVAYKTLG